MPLSPPLSPLDTALAWLTEAAYTSEPTKRQQERWKLAALKARDELDYLRAEILRCSDDKKENA